MLGMKRKQIVVLSLVIMIVVAGYLQYSYKKSSISVGDKGSGQLGEAVYVDMMEEEKDTAGVGTDVSGSTSASKKRG